VSCREVTRRARHVRLDEAALEGFAEHLAREPWPEDELDPAHHFAGTDADRLSFVFVLDAINFGSGWFPLLRKRSGMSGYRTIATACKQAFEAQGSPSAAALRQSSPDSMAELLGQDRRDPDVMELMSLFARAWRDLGDWLGSRFDDSFEAVLRASGNSAERLVGLLAEMPLYRDVSSYEELIVPFYKRAQITVADLGRAFGPGGLGRFDDLDRLTLFADNLVPHVLRCHGVLDHSEALARRIDSGDLLVVGSAEEVEIRAVAVEAVERLVAALGARGRATTAHVLDAVLWNAGQAPAIKARPRHRARSSFY
jgi:hypothetical protein